MIEKPSIEQLRGDLLDIRDYAHTCDDDANVLRLNAALDELAALREAARWIPVTERLPEWSGKPFWVAMRNVVGPPELVHVWFVRCCNDVPFLIGYMREHVRDWMPLPEPPEGA